jgi:hypothetical protein
LPNKLAAPKHRVLWGQLWVQTQSRLWCHVTELWVNQAR